MTKEEAMNAIFNEMIGVGFGELSELRLETGGKLVIGEGDLDASVLFIGEAPGKNEALSGVPFCGASGRILDRLLDSVGFSRESIYITNVVKDRPPKNRDPRRDEIEAYAPFLDDQIKIIAPKVIATLGRFSMEYVMTRYGLKDKCDKISLIHGEEFDTVIDGEDVVILPLYHPAVAVYNANKFDLLANDFAKLKNYEKK